MVLIFLEIHYLDIRMVVEETDFFCDVYLLSVTEYELNLESFCLKEIRFYVIAQ